MYQEKTIVFVVIAGTLLILFFSALIIAFALLYQRRQSKFQQEKKELQSAFENEILKSTIEIQEQTLQHLSQEIHDNIGQILSLAKLNINTILSDIPDEDQQKIDAAKQLITTAIQDLRNLSKSLDTDSIATKGLLAATETELEMIRKSGQFETHLRVEGSPYRLDRNKEVILFRIVQEILNNIIKHAQANSITARFVFLQHIFELWIIDNGKGFDTSILRDDRETNVGLGLKNMQKRARLAGGELILSSQLNKGTSVTIELPNEIPT
jgi:two-component system, NarL family, sensor kinase